MCVGVNVSCDPHAGQVKCIRIGGHGYGIYDVYSTVVAIKKSFVSLFLLLSCCKNF